MISIFVLEDDFLQQGRLETTIAAIMKEKNWSYKELTIFGKPQQLIDAIPEKGNHQIFFLDIEIKKEEKKGLEVANQIRQHNPSAVIVFVTTHSEFMPLTFQYQVSALDFIDKSLRSSPTALNQRCIMLWKTARRMVNQRNFLFSIHLKLSFRSLLLRFCILKHLQQPISSAFILMMNGLNSTAV